MSTIMEALGGVPGETIMEILGGNPGDTIADVIENREKPETWKITLNPNSDTAGFFYNGDTLTPIVPIGEPCVIEVEKGSAFEFDIVSEPVRSLGFLYNGEDAILDSNSETIKILGFAKTAASKTATIESPFTPDKDITLYAVYTELSN